MFLDSDALPGNPSIQDRARDLLTRRAILSVVRMGRTFLTVENNTGDRATDEFVYRNGATWYLAVFNYQQEPAAKHIDLVRALSPGTRYRATGLWKGASFTVLDKFSVNLESAQAALFSLDGP